MLTFHTVPNESVGPEHALLLLENSDLFCIAMLKKTVSGKVNIQSSHHTEFLANYWKLLHRSLLPPSFPSPFLLPLPPLLAMLEGIMWFRCGR